MQTGDTSSSTDGGDEYTGLDRFGRVIDQNYVNTSTGDSTDRFQYTYDRDGNVLSKTNLVAEGTTGVGDDLDETYTYDDLNRLTDATRGRDPGFLEVARDASCCRHRGRPGARQADAAARRSCL